MLMNFGLRYMPAALTVPEIDLLISLNCCQARFRQLSPVMAAQVFGGEPRAGRVLPYLKAFPVINSSA